VNHFSLETDKFFDKDIESNTTLIFFKYREISISKKIYKVVSKLDYTENLKVYKISLEEVEQKSKLKSVKLQTYLNILPLNSNIPDFASLINNNHIIKINGKEIVGKIYKYNDIDIFLYDYFNDNYKGIIYKNGTKYMTFSDKFEDGFLIRTLENSSIFIKDNKIEFIETIIKSKKIEKLSRSITNDNKFFTFDIECYRDELSRFIPYSCSWYTKKKSKVYNKIYNVTMFKN
jgi:hypothetical protein